MWRCYLDCGYSELITSGCDSRLIPNDGGLNRYGCSPLPRRELALGSCSCSSPTAIGTQAARELVADLRRSSLVKRLVAEANERTRDGLRTLLNLSSAVDIALTPSGTDAELLTLALADRDPDRGITNIVIGPGEVGSGTLSAAGGKHYDTLVPRGDRVTSGEAVDKKFAARVETQVIPIRNQRGDVRPAADVDADVQQQVITAVEADRQVLLHAVAHSKTGIYAPRLQTLRQLASKLGDRVTVVVDAAQGRLGSRFGTVGYQGLLNCGYLVSVTGSKFYGGPPFSARTVGPVESPHRRPHAQSARKLWTIL